MTKKLKGKTDLVTGGSRGIGYACAMKLAEQGAKVFLAASNLERLHHASEAIRSKTSRDSEFHAADLRDLKGCQQTADALIKQFKRCDILINSAGATKGGIFPGQPDEEMVDGFALKFHSAVRLSRMLWPELKKNRGCVINIVGGFSRTPSNDFMVGGAVNAALGNFSKALAS